MKRTTTYIVALLLFFSRLFAQREYDKWYFGNNCAIDFSSGNPVSISGSQMICLDNSATISDSSGNLLFYCNGTSIWNRNHQVMPNGTGLLGNSSSGHSATVIRHPGAPNLFYVFTVPHYANGSLRYSIVDMNLAGGTGDVTSTKNVLLLQNCTEKAIAIPHSNGNSAWLLVHEWNSDAFVAYRITSAGLDTAGVVTHIGPVHQDLGGNPGYNTNGQINYHAGTGRVALAVYDLDLFQLYDFDITTGTLSNPITVTGYPRAKGIEFSPDGQRLYFTQWTYDKVYQFDLGSYTETAIAASATEVGTTTTPNPNYKAGYMMLAPDNKIYIAKYDAHYIACISNPNGDNSACGFIDDAVYLNGATSGLGLVDKVILGKGSLSTSEIHDNTPISMYPQPARDKVVIEYNNGAIRELAVLDLKGAVLIRTPNVGIKSTIVDVAALPSATYLLQVIDTDGRCISKLFNVFSQTKP